MTLRRFDWVKNLAVMGAKLSLRSNASKMPRKACKNLLLAARLWAPASIPIRNLLRKQSKIISAETGLPFREAENHFQAQAGRDASVHVSGALKTLAVSLIKIANDLRWLASGPRCAIGAIGLPDTQPGSSIMPGKVNPVLCESVIQVAAHVVGRDATITLCGQTGNFELNVTMPVVTLKLLEAIEFTANAINALTEKCVIGSRRTNLVAGSWLKQASPW
jgi:fumarate hydratase class II